MNCHSHNNCFPGRQRGIALLLMMMVLFTSGSTLFLGAMNNRAPHLDAREQIYSQLELTREALLAYAVNYVDFNSAGEGPGRLPCPASPPTPIANCTVPIPVPDSLTLVLPDGSQYPRSRAFPDTRQGFRLAVSDAFVVNTTQPVNSSGNPDDIVADIHENDNSDLVLSITRSELMSLVTPRVADEIRRRLDDYYAANGNTYPSNSAEFETAMSAAPSWYSSDQWDLLASYTRLSPDEATVSFTGCNIMFSLDAVAGLSRNGNQC